MIRYNKILALLISGIIFIACTDENTKNEWTRQEENIEKFLSKKLKSNLSYRVESFDGSQRLIVKEGTGEELLDTGTISFYYAGYVFNGSDINPTELFATNNESIASAAGWKLTDKKAFNIKTINMSTAKLVEGLKNGLFGVKSGEECIILFSGKHGFGNNLGTIPANSALAYHIWVKSITNE